MVTRGFVRRFLRVLKREKGTGLACLARGGMRVILVAQPCAGVLSGRCMNR